MNGPVWLAWLILVIIAAMGVVLLCGKGAFLIAGYNTMSEEDKAKYDEKKLCRTVGAFLLWCAVLITVALLEVLPDKTLNWLLPAGIVIPCVGLLIAANFSCKKK